MAVQTQEFVQTKSPDRLNVWRTGLLIGGTVAIDTFVNALSAEKLNFLYKNELGLIASSFAALGVILNIPQYIRPFIGVWTDLVPFAGYHRRSYYLLAVIAEAVALFVLSSLRTYTYLSVALLVVVQCFGIVLMFLMMEATLVRVGNETGATGKLQMIQQVVRYALITACTAHLSGYVTQHWSYHSCLRAASITTLAALPLTFLIDEKRRLSRRAEHETHEQHAARALEKQHEKALMVSALKSAASSKGLWVVVAFIFYLILTPGTSTASFYYQVDHLHFTKQLLGDLSAYSAAGSVVGFVTYALFSPRMPIKSLPFVLVTLGTGGYVFNFFLHDPASAKVIAVVGGAAYGWYLLSLLTMGARACPPGVEGTVYGLVYAVQFLGGTLSDVIGSSIYDRFGGLSHQLEAAWITLTWFGIGLTTMAALFIPFMPAWAKSSMPLRSPKPQENLINDKVGQ